MSMEIAWLRWLVSASDLKTSWFTESLRPAKSEYQLRILFQTTSRLPPETMLVAVMAPGFTMAFISAPLYCSTALMELNTCPVASTPMLLSMASGPCSSMTRAMVKGLEMDWMDTSDVMSPVV